MGDREGLLKRSARARKFEAGQLWEIRGWGKAGLFLLLERRIATDLDRDGYEHQRWSWLALCIDSGKTCQLWENFAHNPEYVTRVL